MSDWIIISIVVFVALIAHVWIFRWVKFKMDESTVINFIKQGSNKTVCSSEEIALTTNIKLARVSHICATSKAISADSRGDDYWTLSS